MKTGRRRKKEVVPEAPEPAPEPQPKAVTPPATAKAKRAPAGLPPALNKPWLLILIGVVVLICAGLICARACLGPRAEPLTYLPATADGSWTTTVDLVAPQMSVGAGWRSDCEADINCTVVPGTCEMREREDEYSERVVDEYDDYAYNIYYEEAEGKLYEAAGDSFTVTQLNAPTDWWDEERHYFSEEWLDQETCQYTGFTVWITDPDDADYEIEVVLSECEVWDHVVVKERVYGEEEYCQTENVDAFAILDTLTQRGAGTGVEWPGAVAPADGELEREFEGRVTFRADGASHTVEVTDLDTYIRYLTVPYYLGVDEDGDVVDLTDEAP
jgi:hypothetical protein